jgi:hypothetical protein
MIADAFGRLPYVQCRVSRARLRRACRQGRGWWESKKARANPLGVSASNEAGHRLSTRGSMHALALCYPKRPGGKRLGFSVRANISLSLSLSLSLSRSRSRSESTSPATRGSPARRSLSPRTNSCHTILRCTLIERGENCFEQRLDRLAFIGEEREIRASAWNFSTRRIPLFSSFLFQCALAAEPLDMDTAVPPLTPPHTQTHTEPPTTGRPSHRRRSIECVICELHVLA